MARLLTMSLFATVIAAAAIMGVTTTVLPPSGTYADPAGFQLFSYDNSTGLITPQSAYDGSVCVGDQENRTFIGGICVDVDPFSVKGYDARGYVTLASEWDLTITLAINGVAQNYCVPACFGDAVPGITYFSFQVSNYDACRTVPGNTATVALTIVARDPDRQVSFTGRDTIVVGCKTQQ